MKVSGLAVGGMLLSILLIFTGSANAGLSEDLINAARDKTDANIINDLVERGADVNARDENGATALIWAVRHGHTAIARGLLAAGTNVDASDNNGYTALIWATRKGFINCANVLFKAGADVDLSDNEGVTALMIAAKKQRTYIAKKLIEAGADVNLADKKGRTAMDYATAAPLGERFLSNLVKKKSLIIAGQR